MTGAIAASPSGYTLTHPEEQLSCPQLSAVISSEITRMKGLPAVAKAQQTQPSPTLTNLWSRMTGPKGNGLPASEDYRRSRIRLLGLSDTLWQRGCGRIDVEAELKETDEIMRQGKWS